MQAEEIWAIIVLGGFAVGVAALLAYEGLKEWVRVKQWEKENDKWEDYRNDFE